MIRHSLLSVEECPVSRRAAPCSQDIIGRGTGRPNGRIARGLYKIDQRGAFAEDVHAAFPSSHARSSSSSSPGASAISFLLSSQIATSGGEVDPQ